MILDLNKKFGEYTPFEIIGLDSSFREVYRARDKNNKEVFLLIYNLAELPICYANSEIKEFDAIPLLQDTLCSSYITGGKYNCDDKSYQWVVCEAIPGMLLDEYINSDYKPEEQRQRTINMFLRFIDQICKVNCKLPNLIINNINPSVLWISTDNNGNENLTIIDLSCISYASSEKRKTINFDTNTLSPIYRAPETILGYFNHKTDVFSLGVLLTTLLQGIHPWKIDRDTSMTVLEFAKIVRNKTPHIDDSLDKHLQSIIRKAISAKPSERYKNVMELKKDLAGYINTELTRDCENSENEVPYRSPENVNRDFLDYKQDPPQLRIGLKFERIKGSGFKAVAGMNDLKRKLTRNFIDIIQNDKLAKTFNIKPPNGILLWGPPGTGKTFISTHLVEETNMYYCLIRPSDLANIYLHGSQQLIANVFKQGEKIAQKNKCGVILIFDEFDSIVPKRSINDDNRQANEVAEFLTRLNNCAEKNIYVIATTNRIEAIDPAITRKGRMDEIIYVGLPDDESRKHLIELGLERRPHEKIDTQKIVDFTKGFTSSDITYIIDECARISFAESLKTNQIIQINQSILEQTIKRSIPSVSEYEMRKYEETFETYRNHSKEKRPRIGFNR